MPAYKDSKQGTWYASFYFENWQGVKQKKLKRGFATKKDALAWEREFLLQQAADLTMTFEAFVEIYITDKKKRLRENTWSVKEHIIRTKILPYFKEKRLSEIKPRDVIAWQNEMLNYRDKNGKAYSPTYLKTLHGQLSAIVLCGRGPRTAQPRPPRDRPWRTGRACSGARAALSGRVPLHHPLRV